MKDNDYVFKLLGSVSRKPDIETKRKIIASDPDVYPNIINLLIEPEFVVFLREYKLEYVLPTKRMNLINLYQKISPYIETMENVFLKDKAKNHFSIIHKCSAFVIDLILLLERENK